MKWSFCLLLLASLGGQAADWPAPGAPPAALPQPLFDLPLELVEDHVLLRARSGEQHLNVVLDTGAAGAAIDSSAAQRLDLEPSSKTAAAVGAGGTMQVSLLRDPLNLSFAELELEVDDVVVQDFATLSERFGWRIDAILGAQLLSPFVSQIDYARKRLRLYSPGVDPAGVEAHRFMLGFEGGIPIVEAMVRTLSGTLIEGAFFLDSGAGPSLVIGSYASRLYGLRESARRAVKVNPRGANREFAATMIRLDRLAIGDLELAAPVAMLSEAVDGALAGRRQLGAVGAGFLKRFTVTLDYGQRRLALERNDRFGEPDDYVRSGLELVAAGERFEKFVVRQVLVGTPAYAAGLQPGDRLLEIDGGSVGELTLAEVRERLATPGDQVRLRFCRGPIGAKRLFATAIEPRELL